MKSQNRVEDFIEAKKRRKPPQIQIQNESGGHLGKEVEMINVNSNSESEI